MTPGAGRRGWLDELELSAAGPPWPAMGLRTDPRPWPDPSDPAPQGERARRRRLLDERLDEVAAWRPGTEAAGTEVLALADPSAEPVADEHPLVTAARVVDDDLCLLAPEPGHPLVAGVLCSPSHWRIAAKIGRPLLDVHGPVPGYEAGLSARVDRVIGRLRPGRALWRRNLLVHADGELFAPAPRAAPSPPPESLWLRSERQTLRRLPVTGHVLFTIGVSTAPLTVLRDRPELAGEIARRLRSMPGELARYSGVDVEPVAALLDGFGGAGRALPSP